MNWLKFRRKRLSEDRTRVCGKILGWFVIRGERPIKLRDSWFSAKSILVERLETLFRGRALNKRWGRKVLLNLLKLRIRNQMNLSRQTKDAKIFGQEGNSPDYTLRSSNIVKWENVENQKLSASRLGSSHLLMKA